MGKFIVNLEFGSYIDVEYIEEDDSFTIYSFSSKHRNFIHPTELGLSLERGPNGIPKIKSSKLKKLFDRGLAYFLGYSEHGNCEWYLSTGGYPESHCFDSCNLAGVITLSEEYYGKRKYTKKERKEIAVNFLKDYTDCCNGEIYSFSVNDSEKIEKEEQISVLRDMLSKDDINKKEKESLFFLIQSLEEKLKKHIEKIKIDLDVSTIYLGHNCDKMFEHIYSFFSEDDIIEFKGEASSLEEYYPRPTKKVTV